MLISIHDKNLKRVAFLDNDKPGTLHYFDDTWHRYLVEATSAFDFTVPKPLEAHSDLAFLTEKNYISFRYGNEDYLFNIMKVVEMEDTLTCSCENLNLELLNETASEYKASGAKPFVDYFNDPFLVGGAAYTDLVIGINEISDYRRTLSWEGTDTKLARLLSIVKQFDAECEFETKLNRDGSLDKIVLNVYKAHSESNQGVGKRRNDVTLYYGKEIKSVRRTVDKTGLYTAIRPIGKDGLTIASIPDRVVNDGSGKPLYTKAAGASDICAPQSAMEYPPQMSSKKDSWILLYWSYDTDNPETLYSKGLAKLKSICLPAITYEAEGALNLDIGDTVIIHDAKFTPTLLLEARVSEQEVSFSDPTKNKNVFANFRALENQLSSDITSRLETIVENALPYTMDVLSSDGLVFKNGTGSTTLTPRILKGQKDVTTQVATAWYKDGAAIGSSGAITIAAADIPDKAVYKVTAVSDAGTVLCSAEVTVVDLTDVQAVTIYYLLQASTLAAPSAPTIKEPTNWSTTEPAFDNTTTKTLYTCVRTLYKNGTFDWGDVSVSSSYEAAKVAYNKAAAALPSASFTQNQIFNKLTNNGALQGWFFGKKDASGNVVKVDPAGIDETCDLYVNASYVNAGLLKSLNYVAESAGMTINLADGTIDSKNFKVDASGNIAIKNGGITIKNNDGTEVFSTDANGDLEITGALRMSGSQSVRVDNASGTLVGQLLFEALSGVTWSPGALKVRGYDYLTLEAGADTSITKAYGRIMARGFGLAMIGSEDYGSSGNQSFFCFGQNGTLLGVKVVSTSNSYSETMTFRTKQFPQIIFGSMVRSVANGSSIAMFDNAALNTMLGTSGVTNLNTIVVVGNGDGGACNAHCQDCTYLNGTWCGTFDRIFTGNVRVNYAVITYA